MGQILAKNTGAETAESRVRINSNSSRDFLLFLHQYPPRLVVVLRAMSSPVRVSTSPAIKNAPLIGLAEGNGSFNNYVLAGLVLGVPYFVKKWLPIIRYGGFYTYWFLVLLLGVPVTVAYWTVMSTYGKRKNEKVQLPGKDIEEYISIKDTALKIHYGGKEKIPMQVFHDAYFDGKVDFKGAFYYIYSR